MTKQAAAGFNMEEEDLLDLAAFFNIGVAVGRTHDARLNAAYCSKITPEEASTLALHRAMPDIAGVIEAAEVSAAVLTRAGEQRYLARAWDNALLSRKACSSVAYTAGERAERLQNANAPVLAALCRARA